MQKVFLAVLGAALLIACSAHGMITLSRTINSLDMFKLKLDIDGCTKKDEYGCASFSADIGSNVSGMIHAELKEELDKDAHFEVDAKIKTGIIHVPFKLKCHLCGSVCRIKIPVINKDYEINMPDCPIKAASMEKRFTTEYPDKDQILIKINAVGSVNVYSREKNVASMSFSVSEEPFKSTHVLRAKPNILEFM